MGKMPVPRLNLMSSLAATVNVRSFDDFLSVTAQFIVSEVLGDDADDVRSIPSSVSVDL